MGVLRATLADLAEAQLATIGNCSHYRALIPETPPTVDGSDLRVLAYTVLWPAPGAPGDERAQDRSVLVDLEWRFSVTCAAGLPELVDPLIDLVDDLFNGWQPTIAGHSVGTCEQDYDPGVVRQGTGFTPPRFYLQLPYVLQVGA